MTTKQHISCQFRHRDRRGNSEDYSQIYQAAQTDTLNKGEKIAHGEKRMLNAEPWDRQGQVATPSIKADPALNYSPPMSRLPFL